MSQTASGFGRRVLVVAGASVLAVVVAACGGAPATTSPSVAASVAPSASPSVAASASPSAAASASVAPSTAAVDPADGLTIGAPYTLADPPAAMQQAFEQQMSTALGSFGSSITFGFRQVNGAGGQTILMVLGFPTGLLTETNFNAMIGGIGGSMNATLKTETVDGVALASGKASTGGIAAFHFGDKALIVISQMDADAVPVAKALIAANK